MIRSIPKQQQQHGRIKSLSSLRLSTTRSSSTLDWNIQLRVRQRRRFQHPYYGVLRKREHHERQQQLIPFSFQSAQYDTSSMTPTRPNVRCLSSSPLPPPDHPNDEEVKPVPPPADDDTRRGLFRLFTEQEQDIRREQRLLYDEAVGIWMSLCSFVSFRWCPIGRHIYTYSYTNPERWKRVWHYLYIFVGFPLRISFFLSFFGILVSLGWGMASFITIQTNDDNNTNS